jgi:hypothetical protein
MRHGGEHWRPARDAAEAFYRITDAACESRSVAVTSDIRPG